MRLLFLTLYYPPLNTIAGLRISAFERYLKTHGHSVDVITRYYDEEQQQGKSMFLGSEAPENFNQSYIKKENVIYTNFDARSKRLLFSEKLPPVVRGLYNYSAVDVFHYGWVNYVFDAFERELKQNTYDFIVSSYGPPIAMLIGRKLSEKYNIPYIIDFRDSFIDERDTFFQLYMKKQVQEYNLKNAAGLIFATEGMRQFFVKYASDQLKKIPSVVVYNGVDEKDLSGSFSLADEPVVTLFHELKEKHSFVLLHTGTLYAGQNIAFFFNALDQYNSKHQTNGIIVFLGLAQSDASNQFNLPFVHVLPKVKHATAMYLQKEASALLLPIWDGRYTGFSGKTLEYLYSENFIITSPNPQADLKEFLALSPNVHIPIDKSGFEVELTSILKGQKKQALKEREKLYRSYWIKRMMQFLSDLK